MSLIDDIKRDREAGTQGPWLRDGRLVYALISDGFWRGKEAFRNVFSARVEHDPVSGNNGECDANTRRIARIPDMEAALLAAEELEDAVRLEWDARSAWEDTPQDRGGPHGAKGRALAALQMRRAELHVALTAFQKAVK